MSQDGGILHGGAKELWTPRGGLCCSGRETVLSYGGLGAEGDCARGSAAACGQGFPSLSCRKESVVSTFGKPG